ncbi:MAG: HAD family hydrolase [Deltaproteobacteria bacterium]|nr:MAG: HAD family hydrolase [Deltaproteobacteria bacterium]
MPPWHALAPDEVARRLDTDPDRGLSTQEARRRLASHGRNVLEQVHRAPWYVVLARQFADVLIGILVIAAVVSMAIGEFADAGTILGIVVLNGILGFAQEWKAERELAALARMLAPRCTVIRDGQVSTIDAAELVPGDVVSIEIGDRIPADLRLVDARNVQIDESALTGESLPVDKHVSAVAEDAPLAERADMAWMGTAVVNGVGRGVVVATGMDTQFGRIARLTQTVDTSATPLQRKLAGLGRQLGIASILVAAAVALGGLWTGKQALEMFMTGVSLAVAVVPEGLPAVVMITLALGVRSMVRRRALLRRLQAAETLGAATVICTDKTGTLTQNEMTVQHVWLRAGTVDATGVGYDPAGHFEVDGRKVEPARRPDLVALLETGLLCNHARLEKVEGRWRHVGEPTEAALVTAAYKAWISPPVHPEIVAEFSFNSRRKRMTVVERRDDGWWAHVKGAPEIVLARSTRILDGDLERPLDEAERRAISAAIEDMARRGLRTLALARRRWTDDLPLDAERIEQDLTFLGFVGILDPPRPEVPAAIATARRAGIRTVMITGDAAPTALAIAGRIGLDVSRAVTGAELETMDDTRLRRILRDESVLFARTSPEHKLRIVSAFQDLEEVVGMTGDGVNDAPALKKADIGIAMGRRGTDVAKEAADIVLTDDNFASIVEAVEEGRRQYDNIQKFVRYLLSSNVGEIVAIATNILLGGPLLLLPVQILWMNLVTDGLTAVALGLEPAEEGIMERPPRPVDEPILDREGIVTVLLLGLYIGGCTLWLFHGARAGAGASLVAAHTTAFAAIVILEKVNVFNFRTLGRSLLRTSPFSNPWLLVAWTVTVGLQVAAVYAPPLQRVLHTEALPPARWLEILLAALPVLLLGEVRKALHRRRRRRRAPADDVGRRRRRR